MPRYAARAEFRRRRRDDRWVLAGVRIDGVFHPASPGVEPIRGRLPDTGLLAWADLPTTIIAPNAMTAATVALEVAAQTWPTASRGRAPFASGTAEPD